MAILRSIDPVSTEMYQAWKAKMAQPAPEKSTRKRVLYDNKDDTTLPVFVSLVEPLQPLISIVLPSSLQSGKIDRLEFTEQNKVSGVVISY